MDEVSLPQALAADDLDSERQAAELAASRNSWTGHACEQAICPCVWRGQISGRSVGLLGHTQRKVLNLSLADHQRQRHPNEGGHGLCRIRSIDWRKKGSLRASRYHRAALDQVLLCVLTGTSTEQIGNAQFLKRQQPHLTPYLPQHVG